MKDLRIKLQGKTMVSPTSELTQGGAFIALRNVVRENNKDVDRPVIVSLNENNEEVITEISHSAIRNSNDWIIS